MRWQPKFNDLRTLAYHKDRELFSGKILFDLYQNMMSGMGFPNLLATCSNISRLHLIICSQSPS